MRDGAISDYTITEKMLRHFIKKSQGRYSFIKPRATVCVPSGVTEVEKKAVEEATLAAGARDVVLIEEPVAAAIGAGIDISRACGNFIVDIGGGTCDIAVISLGGTVVKNSIKVAGNVLDHELVRYFRNQHNMLVGLSTAEEIKIKIGNLHRSAPYKTAQVKGRNMITGMPATKEINSDEVREAFKSSADKIIEAIIGVLEQTPPELAADILSRGIILTGGSALITGFDRLIEEKTGIRTITAGDPLSCAVIGTGEYDSVMEGRFL